MSIQDLLSLNNLHYLADTSANANIQRQQRTYYPEKSSYKATEKISIKMHGNAFVDFSNSSLRFVFTPVGTAGGNCAFGSDCSSINLFNRCRIVAPGGETISDLLDVNLLAFIETKLKQSAEYNFTVGPSYGLASDVTPIYLNNQSYEFTLPLIHLSPFFRGSDKLCPPQLAEGLIIELYLENVSTALISTGATTTGFLVEEVELMADGILVADSVSNAIMDMSEGQNIMVYEWSDVVDNASFNSAEEKNTYFEIPQSLTNALETVTTTRVSASVNDAEVNSFFTYGPADSHELSTILNDDQFSAQLGSTKFPQQTLIGGPRIYQNILYSQGVLNNTKPACFNLVIAEFYNNHAMYCTDLRLSKIYDNSGRTISDNQRFSVFIKNNNSVANVCNVFVYHTARVEIRNNRCSVVR